MEPVIDTIHVISVVDSSFMSNLDSLSMGAFNGGIELGITACMFSAAIVMLGVAIHRAVGSP